MIMTVGFLLFLENLYQSSYTMLEIIYLNAVNSLFLLITADIIQVYLKLLFFLLIFKNLTIYIKLYNY